MKLKTNVICPVAFELTRNLDNKVVLGLSTIKACDLAVDIAERSKEWRQLIVPTAGCAGKKWDCVFTASLMEENIKHRTCAQTLTSHSPFAPSYDTLGEMYELASFVFYRQSTNQETMLITLAVKSWHAPRCKFLLKRCLKLFDLNIPIAVETYSWQPPLWIYFKEFLWSWPTSFIRSFFLNRY